MSSELGLRRRRSRARSEDDDEQCESGDEVRVSGEVVPVEEDEESGGELEEELGEKAVLRRRREGVRSGENDWKLEVRMVTVLVGSRW